MGDSAAFRHAVLASPGRLRPLGSPGISAASMDRLAARRSLDRPATFAPENQKADFQTTPAVEAGQ